MIFLKKKPLDFIKAIDTFPPICALYVRTRGFRNRLITVLEERSMREMVKRRLETRKLEFVNEKI